MSKVRILIVADDAALAAQTGAMLRDSGLYEVLIGNESSRAVEIAHTFHPRVILLDLDTSPKRAKGAAEALASDPFLRHVPILFLTSLVPGGQAGLGQLASGGMRLVSKPVDPERLLQSVAQFAPTAPREATPRDA